MDLAEEEEQYAQETQQEQQQQASDRIAPRLEVVPATSSADESAEARMGQLASCDSSRKKSKQLEEKEATPINSPNASAAAAVPATTAAPSASAPASTSKSVPEQERLPRLKGLLRTTSNPNVNLTSTQQSTSFSAASPSCSNVHFNETVEFQYHPDSQPARQQQHSTRRDANGNASRSTPEVVESAQQPPPAKRQRFEDRIAADEAAAAVKAAVAEAAKGKLRDRNGIRRPGVSDTSAGLSSKAAAVDQSEGPMLRTTSADRYFDAYATGQSGKRRGVGKVAASSGQLISRDFCEPLTSEMVAEMHQFPSQGTGTGSSREHAFHTETLETLALRVNRCRYTVWTQLLHQGFKLLFHGVGTAEAVLRDFAQQKAAKGLGTAVVVRGYLSSGMTQVINELWNASVAAEHDFLSEGQYLIEDAQDEDDEQGTGIEHTSSVEAKAHRLRNRYAASTNLPPLYVVLLGIDHKQWLQPRAQQILKILSDAPKIYLIASATHVQSGALLGAPTSSGSHSNATHRTVPWAWQELSTFVPPVDEMLVTSASSIKIDLPDVVSLQSVAVRGRGGGHDGQLALSGGVEPAGVGTTAGGANESAQAALRTDVNLARAMHVLKSVTQKARQMFDKLARMQIHESLGDEDSDAFVAEAEQQKEQLPQPVLVPAIVEQCGRQFIATSAEHFKTLLTEFTSHGLIRYAVQSSASPQLTALARGKEYLWINMSLDALRAVLPLNNALMQDRTKVA